MRETSANAILLLLFSKNNPQIKNCKQTKNLKIDVNAPFVKKEPLTAMIAFSLYLKILCLVR